MDKYLEDIIRDIRIIFLKHSRELCEVECKKADEEATEKLETLDNSSRDKQDNIEERYEEIDKIFEQRKDVLQFHRTSFASHQDAMTDCVNEVKSRKEEVVEEQETILLKLDEIVDWVLPKMNAATNSKQLVEINKEVLIQFDDVKQQMKLTVSNYTKWSYEKESSLNETSPFVWTHSSTLPFRA